MPAVAEEAKFGAPWGRIYHDIIDCLAAALEARDRYTEGHSQRVADMAFQLAQHLGLSLTDVEAVHIAAHLHDIGKISWPDQLFGKAGPLTDGELAVVRSHPTVGYDILSRSQSLLPLAALVLSHHERWDGHGYPHGLASTSIPLGARIIALCDSIDAMTSHRPYRDPLSWEECRTEVERAAGTQFDPHLVIAARPLWPTWQRARE